MIFDDKHLNLELVGNRVGWWVIKTIFDRVEVLSQGVIRHIIIAIKIGAPERELPLSQLQHLMAVRKGQRGVPG